METTGNESSRDGGAAINQENSRNFIVRVPCGVASFFSVHLGGVIHAEKMVGKEPSELLRKLKEKFDGAISNSPQLLGLHRKTPISLSYTELDFLGRSELDRTIKYAAAMAEPEETTDNPKAYVLQKALANKVAELGKAVKTDLSLNGMAKKDFAEFCENFLALNSAFMKAGGKDNSSLRKIFETVKNDNKTK